MAVYIQHSYGKSDKILKSIEKNLVSGVIFSPKGESSVQKMIDTVAEYAQMGVETYFDPNFHLSLIENCPDNKIKDYAYYKSNLKYKDFISPKRILEYVETCLDFQNNLNVTSLFLEGFNQTLMEQIKHNEITLSTIEHIFHYFKENRDFCIVILGEHGNTKILTEFLEIGKKKYKETYSQEYNEFMDYQYQFISAGCLGVLKQWLFDENQISEEEIAKIVYRLINGK